MEDGEESLQEQAQVGCDTPGSAKGQHLRHLGALTRRHVPEGQRTESGAWGQNLGFWHLAQLTPVETKGKSARG